MSFKYSRFRGSVPCVALVLLMAQVGLAGISRAFQEQYRRRYQNKALFLKVPIFSERHLIAVGSRLPQSSPSTPPRFKVGDQVRILGIEFGGDEIKFHVGAIAGTGSSEILFKFDGDLAEEFPNRDQFEAALGATFTEGLRYSDLEDAKKGYVEDAFERAVREIASTSGASRETVLKNMAPRLPAYQDALRDLENLKVKNQDLTGQVAQLQSENRRVETELRQHQAEVSKLRGLSATLQEKTDSSSTQVTRLGDDIKNLRGQVQAYQSQFANLQRSLNIRVDPNRELALQFGDVVQATKKLQKDGETLVEQNNTLRTNLEKEQAASKRLSGEIEDAKNSNRQMRETIETLSSKEDSLARQYLKLKQVKENLENVTLSMGSLTTQTVDDKSQAGTRSRKANVYLRNILLGTLEWKLPERLSPNGTGDGEARFATESIDYVRVAPEERHVLRSLGERFKVGMKLSSLSSGMEVKPGAGEALQEVGERDQATWRWHILNRGTEDTRIVLAVTLLNGNGDEIPLAKEDHVVLSSSVVRQARNYLQPIPIGLGVLLGLLAMAIVGVFRRGRRSEPAHNHPQGSRSDPPSYIGQRKQL
jgi:predicted nuclease with TOPRIM domain